MEPCYDIFWAAWQSGLALETCLSFVSQNNFSGTDLSGYNLGPNYQHWGPYQRYHYDINTPDGHIRIYGYAGINRGIAPNEPGFIPGYDNSPYYK